MCNFNQPSQEEEGVSTNDDRDVSIPSDKELYKPPSSDSETSSVPKGTAQDSNKNNNKAIAGNEEEVGLTLWRDSH